MSRTKGAPVVATGKKSKRDKSNKNKKYDRSRSWCRAYRAACRRESNKKRKLRRHIKRYPADLAAKKALDRLS